MDGISLLTIGISILGLIVAFYSLVLSTQRIPNFLTSLYSLIKHSLWYLLFGVVFLLICSVIIDVYNQFVTEENAKFIIDKKYTFYICAVIIIFLILSVRVYFYREYRKVFFFKCNDPWYIIFKDNEKKKGYESPKNVINDDKRKNFCGEYEFLEKDVDKLFCERQTGSLSLFCGIESRIELDKVLIKMSYWALREDLNLVYLSCSRHPVEFVEMLKKEIEKDNSKKIQWENTKKQILLIDAHTNHFGFKEPIYRTETEKLKSERMMIETADFSFVGIHSAIADGYEEILQKADNGKRKDKTSLLIYDSCFALSDLESEKLYRIFLKHVIPSEKLMGGNITVFVEQWLPEDVACFVKAMTDAEIKNIK